MTFQLTESSAVEYLAHRGLIEPPLRSRATARILGGGVSNVVILVDVPGSAGGMVLKQSLPRLRVEQEWLADQSRIHREAAALRYLRDVLPSGSLPEVIHEDRSNYIFAMTPPSGPGVNWKDALLSGDIEPEVACEVGSMLGTMHRASACQKSGIPPELQEFSDQDGFVQLRIDPYHRATAAAHPWLADLIEDEAQKMLGNRVCLVHGDFSPKNLIALTSPADPGVFLLDFEVVHLGNPAFDLAFMLNHLTLKAIHRPQRADRYCAAARAFWSAYADAVGPAPWADGTLESATIRQMGALLLARIDGKSPAEYIVTEAEKSRCRTLAEDILRDRVQSLDELHHIVGSAAR